jgi:hypothetical protein
MLPTDQNRSPQPGLFIKVKLCHSSHTLESIRPNLWCCRILYPSQIPCYVTCCQIAWNLLLSALKKKLSPRCWSHCRVSGVFAELIAADFLLVRTVACCLLLSSSWVSRPEPAQCWLESFHSCNVWLLSAGLKNILFDIFQTVSRVTVHL